MPIVNALSNKLASDATLAARWSDFSGWLVKIEPALAALPNNFSFVVRGESSDRFVGSVPVADFKRKFAAISWTLVGDDFDNGGVGEVKSIWKKGAFRKKWVSAEQKTNAANFLGYAAQPDDRGLIYLALHETSHVTELGLDVGNQCWNMYLQTGKPQADYARSDGWTYNESVANSIVREVCAKLDLPLMANPGGGFVQ